MFNSFDVPENWFPPTAIKRKDRVSGPGLGYGIGVTYRCKPGFLVTHPKIKMIFGFGYYKERFDIMRPFDYESPLEPIFYTDHYSYECLKTMLGLAYTRSIGPLYSLSADVSYNWLWMFKQNYTPVSNHGYGGFRQSNYARRTFGHKVIMAVGVNRALSKKWSLSVQLLLPVSQRFRNDEIFNDDPSKYFRPNFSLGTAVGVAYAMQK